jgi:predicted nucleotidyltransferase
MKVNGLESFVQEELFFAFMNHIGDEAKFVSDDFQVTKICVVGSRITNSNRADSDVDVAFQYTGRYREDSMCDVLNMEPLVLDGIRVDFVPYAEYKGSSVDMEKPHLDLSFFLGE